MKISEIRNWLGLYFLIITGILGAYILLCSETPLLPISKAEATSSFEIIIPVLVAQITAIFKWYSVERKVEDVVVEIPTWVIKGPPIMVTIILLLSITNLVVGNLGEGKTWAISPDSFKGVITFCVTLLNATSIFIIMRFFKAENTKD